MGGGWALEIKTFLGQMALASLVAMSEPKKASIFRAHPFQWPSKWVFPHQNHYIPRRTNTGTQIVNLSSCECSKKQHLGTLVNAQRCILVTAELLTQKLFIKVQVYGYTVLCRDMTYHEGSKIKGS